MPLSEDEIDDLLYFARVGDAEDYKQLTEELCQREGLGGVELLPQVRDPHSGNGPLHMAAGNGHIDLLTLLLTPLSSQTPSTLKIINAPNSNHNTPLHWACLNGHLPCVKLLLEAGADPTIKNDAGHDAVFEAEINERSEVVEWVLKEGGEGLESGVAGGDGEGEFKASAGDVEGEGEVEEVDVDVDVDGVEDGVEGMRLDADGEGKGKGREE